MVPAFVPSSAGTEFPAELLPALLEVSRVAVCVLHPVYGPDPAGGIVDFRVHYASPAARGILGPGSADQELPDSWLRSPNLPANGLFDFYRRAFGSNRLERFEINYPADGLAGQVGFAAIRQGEQLVVSFTDLADHGPSAVEEALRQSQAREQAARAEAEAQRSELQRVFIQAPVGIAVLRGPEYVIELINPVIVASLGRTSGEILGRPVHTVWPEAAKQGLEKILDGVLATGSPHVAHEQSWTIDRHGRLDTLYWNFVCQPLREADGQTTGIVLMATDVSEQVAARQQLRRFNEQLEARVTERTQELARAQAETEQQWQRLELFFEQASAAICVLSGPDLVYEMINPAFQQLLPGRKVVGRPILEALPELGETVYNGLQAVYATGGTYGEQNRRIFFARSTDGVLEERYFTFLSQARYAAPGRINGLVVCIFEVTAQVQTQQRADALQAELLANVRLLAQEREKFYQILQHAPFAISILRGPTHRYEYCNIAYQNLFPGRQLLGRTVAEAKPESVPLGFVEALDEVYRTGVTTFGYEKPLTVSRPDGQAPLERYFTVMHQAYREQGEIVGITIFSYDVTEQVLARQQREKQQRQVRELFEQAPVAVALLRGPRYVIELANPAICTMWGRTPAQALGTPLFELLPEAAGQGFEQLLDGVLATGVPHIADELPVRIDRGDRHDTVYFNFVYHPLREADSRISGVAVVATEVSELLRTRRQLATQRQLQAVFEQAPVAVGVFSGADYVVDVCNPGLQEMWGRTAAQALHRPVFEVLPETRDQGFKELLDEVVRSGEPHVAREVPLQVQRHDQLTTVHVNFVYHPLRNAEGRVTAVAAVATDVSEQVAARQLLQRRNDRKVSRLNKELAAANEQLRLSNAELEQRVNDRTHALLVTLEQLERRGRELTQALAAEQELGELKTRFVTMASHEFRTPLAVVLTSATLVAKYVSTNQQPQRLTHLAHIRAAVQHLNDILEEFLMVGRIEEGKIEAHPATFDLSVLLADIVATAHGTLKAGQTVVQQVQCPNAFRLDVSLLRKILVNLLSNALKYSGEHSVVTIRARCHDSVLTLSVQDQGVGISADDQAHLFERFFRARNVTNVPGTGMGLYIIARYLELMSGTIALESELAVGTTFTLTIPYENYPAN